MLYCGRLANRFTYNIGVKLIYVQITAAIPFLMTILYGNDRRRDFSFNILPEIKVILSGGMQLKFHSCVCIRIYFGFFVFPVGT